VFFSDLELFFNEVGDKSNLLGLDIGTKTVGLAISDLNHIVATPFHTIKRKKFTLDLENLTKLIEDNDIKGLVIGLPLMLDGEEGAKCQSVRQFGKNILKVYEIPIIFWDERFSTVSAEETLLKANMSRQDRSELIDKVAASVILQNLLDSYSNINK